MRRVSIATGHASKACFDTLILSGCMTSLIFVDKIRPSKCHSMSSFIYCSTLSCLNSITVEKSAWLSKLGSMNRKEEFIESE